MEGEGKKGRIWKTQIALKINVLLLIHKICFNLKNKDDSKKKGKLDNKNAGEAGSIARN